MIEFLLLAGGLSILTVGADLLVRGASAVALRIGLSEIVVGLTVVAFGTSAPELAVSLKAALGGQGDISVGNIVGSNIFNVAAILGISAMVCPLVVHLGIVRRDMPVLIGCSIGFIAFLSFGGGIGRGEGTVLVAVLLAYVGWSIRQGRKLPTTDETVTPKAPTSLWLSIGLVLVGLAMLVFGARLFVDGAVGIARDLGWSEAVIGLTIVAAGTSMPELATSVVAALRKQTDIAVGNVVGSNIFNLLCIGGITATVEPLRAGGIGWLDLGAMFVASLILIPLMRTGFRLERWEGGVLFAMFVGYLWAIWP